MQSTGTLDEIETFRVEVVWQASPADHHSRFARVRFEQQQV
jgi:hypothetical protein